MLSCRRQHMTNYMPSEQQKFVVCHGKTELVLRSTARGSKAAAAAATAIVSLSQPGGVSE